MRVWFGRFPRLLSRNLLVVASSGGGFLCLFHDFLCRCVGSRFAGQNINRVRALGVRPSLRVSGEPHVPNGARLTATGASSVRERRMCAARAVSGACFAHLFRGRRRDGVPGTGSGFGRRLRLRVRGSGFRGGSARCRFGLRASPAASACADCAARPSRHIAGGRNDDTSLHLHRFGREVKILPSNSRNEAQGDPRPENVMPPCAYLPA